MFLPHCTALFQCFVLFFKCNEITKRTNFMSLKMGFEDKYFVLNGVDLLPVFEADT